jgi:hypothetical protein
LRTLESIDRLQALLEWVNGRPMDLDEVRQRLRGFIASFDGGPASGYVAVDQDTDDVLALRRVVDAESAGEGLRMELAGLLESGFQDADIFSSRLTLHISVQRKYRGSSGKLSQATAEERRAFEAAGAYVLVVWGSLLDLIPFLVAHLLTMPGGAYVRRCQAPAPHDPPQRCGRFLIGHGKGRPREYCLGSACRVRAYAERLAEYERRVTGRRKRIRRARKAT